jgi:hypothetical protein
MITWSKSTMKILTNKFDMKCSSVANVIIEIKIARKSDELTLSQSYYTEKIFDKFSKGNNRIVETQMNISVYLSKNKCMVID